MAAVAKMAANKKKINAVRVLGQKLKRKEVQLQKVKESESSCMAKVLSDIRKALPLSEKRHKQMEHDKKVARKRRHMQRKRV